MPEDSGRPESEWSKIVREEEAARLVDAERLLRSVKPAERAAPRLRDEALYGPHGDYCRAVEGKTEATTPAILAHLLGLFGCWTGPRAWMSRGLARHGPNVSCVIVGSSASSMKGTALNIAKLPYERAGAVGMRSTGAVPLLVGMQIDSGFASGEALIDRVVDPDIVDPRLLVVESEFASLLKRSARDGSTLGQVLRQVFDQSRLSTSSRGHGAKIAEPESYWMSFLGHITPWELAATLDASSMFGGTVNRFLWWHAPESSLTLTDEEPVPESAVRAYIAALELAGGGGIAATKAPPVIGEINFAPEAMDLWQAISEEAKASDTSGLMDAATGRARSMVMRLSVNYALSVGRRVVGLDELRAAQAVWEYCRASAWQAFGKRTGSPDIDGLVQFLEDPEQAGRATPEELKGEFGNHYRVRVDKAIALGIVRRTKLAGSSGPGRKPVVFELVM